MLLDCYRRDSPLLAQSGHRLNINVIGKVEMSEALNTVAGELLEQIASS